MNFFRKIYWFLDNIKFNLEHQKYNYIFFLIIIVLEIYIIILLKGG
jgi:hypothetical protein